MLTNAVFLVCVVLISTLDQIDLGARLNKDEISGRSLECVATPSQTYPCEFLTVEGVHVAVGYERDNLRIKYLSIQDKHFKTKDGLQVGASVTVSEDQLVAIPGWKVFGPRAKSGWRPVFGYFGEKVRFSDGTVVDLAQPRHDPPRAGQLEILELEKGGV